MRKPISFLVGKEAKSGSQDLLWAEFEKEDSQVYLKAALRSSPPVCLPLYSTHTSQNVSFHLCILKQSTSIKLYIFKICLALAIFLKIPYEWAGYNHFSLLLQKECLNHTTRYCNKETYLLWMISKKDTFVSMILLNLPVGTLLF